MQEAVFLGQDSIATDIVALLLVNNNQIHQFWFDHVGYMPY